MNVQEKWTEFHFENGLEAFIDYLNTNKDVLLQQFQSKDNKMV